MSAEWICDGCGKREPAMQGRSGWFSPKSWYSRGDDYHTQDACSRECIDKIAKATGKTNVVLPI